MGKILSVVMNTECDGCGYVATYVVDSDITGYEGTIFFNGDNGHVGRAEWYACKKACVPNAVLNRVSEVLNP